MFVGSVLLFKNFSAGISVSMTLILFLGAVARNFVILCCL